MVRRLRRVARPTAPVPQEDYRSLSSEDTSQMSRSWMEVVGRHSPVGGAVFLPTGKVTVSLDSGDEVEVAHKTNFAQGPVSE